MSDEDYNGYPNRATWLVAFHIGNEEPAIECMKSLLDYAEFPLTAIAAMRLAKKALRWCAHFWPDMDDLTFDDVDWPTLATDWNTFREDH